MLLIWAVAAPGLGRFATSLTESGVGRFATSLAGSGIVSWDQREVCHFSGRGSKSLPTSVARAGTRRFATSVAESGVARFATFLARPGTGTFETYLAGQGCAEVFRIMRVCRSVQNNADPLIVAQLYSKILFEPFWARLA
jgi:hypothetical protein